MKNIYYLLIIIVLTAFSCYPVKEDEKEIKRFITEAVDARMMDREEGKLASERGTTEEIREYGKLMVKDQTFLLDKLQKLAISKKINLPENISEEKSEALKELKEKTGSDFDKKFLRMIKIDHKRDVKEFKNASEYKDEKVKAFAIKHLPMIEKHLEGVEKIKEEM